MKKIKTGFSIRLALVLSGLLLCANLLLGTVLTGNSTASMKMLIDSRMSDIANSAADMLDGDDLGSLTKEDMGSEKYQRINDTLAVFQNNIDLKYIYCIRETEDGEFVFSVDPTIEDPGEFGEPVVYTDALYNAARGIPSVDKMAYTDEWGRFYSAYSPVFDSDNNVAGIVAVDFSADWYDAQIDRQKRSIAICTSLEILFGVMLLWAATARFRNQLRSVSSDLKEVMKDVEELNRVIDPEFTSEGKREALEDNIQELSVSIRRIRDDLREYTGNLNSQANSMVTALSSEYRSVYYVNLDRDEGICYRAHSHIDNGLREGEHFSYRKTLTAYAEDYVTEEFRDAFIEFTDIASIRKELENERIITFRYTVNRNDQESYEMIKMAGVRDPEDRDDHIIHAVGMGFADVDAETRQAMTQSRALSDALTAAQGANKAKTAFLSNMSHEIRTPMNAIIGLDRIALSDPAISDSTREYLEKIGVSAEHLLGIINDILDMSRIEAGRMVLKNELFSLHALLEQINVLIGGQCREKGIKWTRTLSGDVKDNYIGDDVKLKQVLLNILGNAVKFTPSGGEISFDVEKTANYNKKTTLCFTVSDTGIGMDSDFLPKLFEPFSQEDPSTKTKYGSTGLGMSITKSIVEMMNGDIRAESEKNAGTTFKVTITLSDSEQDKEEEGELDPKEMNVLIVDDDPLDADYAGLELENAGITSEKALSGAQALEMVRIKNARREAYNLILMDWKMPEMDGLETTRQIRSAIGDESAIVILTSYQWEEIQTEGIEAGVDGFTVKPLRADMVLSQFKQAILKRAKNCEVKAELKGRRVLMAEDMDINAEIIIMILSMRDIKADHAANGKIAVEMFAQKPEGYYDAVLMDMRMPEMDGLEATKAIRSMDRADAGTIPIIALTANAFDEDVQRSLQAGLNAHLSKPIEPESLFETLESLIRPSNDI